MKAALKGCAYFTEHKNVASLVEPRNLRRPGTSATESEDHI